MEDLTYNIVYKGRILDGHDFDGVKSRLVEAFSLSPEKAEQLLNSKRAIIKKNLDQAAVKKLGMALKQAGLDVVMTQFSIPASEMPSPGEGAPEKAPRSQPEEPVLKVSEPEARKTMEKNIPNETLPFEFHGSGGNISRYGSLTPSFPSSPWVSIRHGQKSDANNIFTAAPAFKIPALSIWPTR